MNVHDVFNWVLDKSGPIALGTIIIVAYRVQLMWGDYKKKHKINGDFKE